MGPQSSPGFVSLMLTRVSEMTHVRSRGVVRHSETVMSALRRLRQEGAAFKTSLGRTGDPVSK